MKIAIKANHNRGKEIISLLESLGGIKGTLDGSGIYYTYYIDKNNMIRYSSPPKDYKVYTLEEFEKEFPFKVGDTVSLKRVDQPYKIVALELYMDKLYYKLDNGLHYRPGILITYKEMKEERNIKLTLDKAKEWYKKGGELKEIALQAFTEKELTKVDLPKTWEEFCENCPIKKGESYIDDFSDTECFITGGTNRDSVQDKNVCPSNKSAEAHLAMIQLEQLRDCWRQGWKPSERNTGYCIAHYHDGYSITSLYCISFLSFPTKEIAEKFLEYFRDLIEKAGDLI